VALVTLGPAATLKHVAHEPEPPSELVTVSVRKPVVAPDSSVMFAVMDVELVKFTELTFTPLPENDTVGMAENPVPVITTSWLVPPCPRELGLALVAVGEAVTVKQSVGEHVTAEEPSAFRTVKLRAPVDAIVLLKVAVI